MFLLVVFVSQFFLCVFTGGLCEPALFVCFYWGFVGASSFCVFLLVVFVSQFFLCVFTGGCVSQLFLCVFTGDLCEPVLSVCFYWCFL